MGETPMVMVCVSKLTESIATTPMLYMRIPLFAWFCLCQFLFTVMADDCLAFLMPCISKLPVSSLLPILHQDSRHRPTTATFEMLETTRKLWSLGTYDGFYAAG